MKFVDLYCGAGLGARGAVDAGGEPVIAVDIWNLATETYRSNFPQANVLTGSVAEINPTTIPLDSPIDLMLASPECTSHSIARGRKPKNRESQRTALTFLPWVDELRPRWIVIENVTRMRDWEGHIELKCSLERRGYKVEESVLNANDFGVPQARKRLYMVCGSHALPPTQADLEVRMRPGKAAKEVLDINGKWPSRPLYREGRAKATIERAERAISELGRRVPFLVVYYGSDYAGGWQSLDAPLRTITTIDRFGLVTWNNDVPMLRMLQPPELLRAMGAENHTLTHGTRRNKVKLCGNGICAPVMQTIVDKLMSLDRAAALPTTAQAVG